MVAESETSAFRLAAWSTAINVLVASGFATAGSSLRGRSCRPAPGRPCTAQPRQGRRAAGDRGGSGVRDLRLAGRAVDRASDTRAIAAVQTRLSKRLLSRPPAAGLAGHGTRRRNLATTQKRAYFTPQISCRRRGSRCRGRTRSWGRRRRRCCRRSPDGCRRYSRTRVAWRRRD